MKNSDIRFSTDSERDLLALEKKLCSITSKLELYWWIILLIWLICLLQKNYYCDWVLTSPVLSLKCNHNIVKELSKTLISETSQTLWSKSTVSDTNESVKKRSRKRKTPAQKEDDIYTLKNKMKRIELHWDRIWSLCNAFSVKKL